MSTAVIKNWIAKRLDLPQFAWLPVIAILLLLAILTIVAGILAAFGADIYANPPQLPSKDFLTKVWDFARMPINITVTPLIILIAILLFGPVYRFVFKVWLNRQDARIFIEQFEAPKMIWFLDYWGADKGTTRYLDGHLVFTSTSRHWPRGESGAFCDLHSGIFEGAKYKVECRVKSDNSCTMGFRLWVPGTDANPGPGITSPGLPDFQSPTTSLSTYSVIYTANNTNAMRIHLHCRAGAGNIQVKEVKVTRV